MFAKILQNTQLSSQEQKDILKAIIQVNLKQNLPEVKLQLTHHYAQLKPILIKHWKYALRIAFALIPWQSAREFVQGKREGAVFDLIKTIAEEGDLKHSGEYLAMELFKVYSDPWRCLVILALAAQSISPRIGNVEDYYWFLAGFIRISAGIIQNYLTTKNEPTKSNEDRIDKDLVLVGSCESWITNSYLTLFNNLKPPQSASQKQILLSALSQIIGALYQSQRQGHLNVQLLHRIQQGGAQYLFKGYRLDQIRDILIARLKQQKYFNPIKKIQIPDRYTSTSHIQTQGICWIINRYLQQLQDVSSTQQKLDYSLLLYSQILPLPYKLKESLISNIHHLLQTAAPSPNFQTNYPLGLLLFNVYHFQRHQFNKLSQKLQFNHDKLLKVNRLKRLLSINIQNLNVEKTQFVLNHLDEESLSLKQTLLLLKAVKFNFTSPQLAKLVTSLFQRVSKCHGQLGRKTVLTIINRQRQQKHNTQLCHELQKIYSK